MKYKTPTEREKEIIRRNGIDPEGVAVIHSDDDTIHLLRYTTRDEITINRGDKPW